MNGTSKIKPMNFWVSLLFFGIPALVVILCVYVLIPYFKSQGLTDYMSYCWALLASMIPMFIASLVAYRLEGNSFTWAAFKDRFRLPRMTGKDWLWTGALFLFMLVSYYLFLGVGRWLVTSGIIPLPAHISAMLDPLAPANIETLKNALGNQFQGKWSIVIISLVLLFFNIIGEEFWWRGYILPRQELAMGKRTWVIHGILWCLFHAFKYWDWLALLPTTLGIAFVAQRLKNTWPGIITHLLLNGTSVVGILLLVLTGGPR